MKVVLDLSRLLQEGAITAAEFERLRGLAAQDTAGTAFNILVGLGVTAVVAAGLALVPSPLTALALGLLLMAAALLLLRWRRDWDLLATLCLLVGALMFGGGFLVLADGSAAGCLAVAVLFGAVAALARSALLTVLAVSAFAAALGAGTFYDHASYALTLSRPLAIILGCGILAFVAYRMSRRAKPALERLWLVGARAGLFYVNLGFWIGSLWGDDVGRSLSGPNVSPTAFALGWAVALVAVGFWAARANRRWVVNVVTVFGAIHAYTQWFEHLSATPLTVLVAGLATLALALTLWKWNARALPPPRP